MKYEVLNFATRDLGINTPKNRRKILWKYDKVKYCKAIIKSIFRKPKQCKHKRFTYEEWIYDILEKE